jgi:hypothetical protein
LIVLFYSCLALVLLARQGTVQQTAPRTASARPPRGLVVGLSCVAAGIGLGIGILAGGGSGFTIGRVMVGVAAVTTVLALLALIRGVELQTPTPPTSPSPGDDRLGRPEGQPPPLQPSPRRCSHGGPAAVPLEGNLEDGGEQPGRQHGQRHL